MAEVDEYVEPLSGEEIVVDLCALIAAKLRADCNLRASDAYSGGYMATVSIHLEAYGMDTATVEAAISTGKQQDNPDELINTTYEIPAETALNKVRERSDQPVPTLSSEGGQPVIKPRRYVRGASKVTG
jgi:hypothetical protein